MILAKDVHDRKQTVFLLDLQSTRVIRLRAVYLFSETACTQYTRAMRSECGYLKARLSRVTIEITSRVIVVAAHNSSGNSGNGGCTYACLVPPDTHEISNWRIVDFNGARGKIRARTRENTQFPIGERERKREYLHHFPLLCHVSTRACRYDD